MCSGTIVAISICIKKQREASMKIEIPFLAALFLIGTSLLARGAVQWIEQALLATVAEYGANVIKARRKLLAPNID